MLPYISSQSVYSVESLPRFSGLHSLWTPRYSAVPLQLFLAETDNLAIGGCLKAVRFLSRLCTQHDKCPTLFWRKTQNTLRKNFLPGFTDLKACCKTVKIHRMNWVKLRLKYAEGIILCSRGTWFVPTVGYH